MTLQRSTGGAPLFTVRLVLPQGGGSSKASKADHEALALGYIAAKRTRKRSIEAISGCLSADLQP